MKCPKCGYLGFEATDRCRNCGYDFSFATPAIAAELPLRATIPETALADLALQQPEEIGSLDGFHDRDTAGFGRPGPREAAGGGRVEPREAAGAGRVEPGEAASVGRGELRAAVLTPAAAPAVPAPHAESDPVFDPADDLPLFSPRPAGTPLGVRRPGSEVPRVRRTTTRPLRMDAPVLPLVMDASDAADAPAPLTGDRSRAAATAGVPSRLGAAFVDLMVLLLVDAASLWLTLRIAGLQPTAEDLAVIRPVPMAAFFLVVAFLYLVGFTVGGGKTIGKMLTGIRVTGDDGRGVDLTGAVVRALGSLATAATLGLLFVPVFFSPERRAVHDRLAGTRVVVG